MYYYEEWSIKRREEHTVVPGSTSLAISIVAVLVEETPAALRTLWHTLTINIGVDLDATNIAQKLTFVLNCPTDNFHVDCVVGKFLKASKHTDPLVVLLLQRSLDAGPLRGSNTRFTLPTHAIVNLAFPGHDLVEAIILEAEGIRVRLNLVLPDLLQASLKLRWWIPALLRQIALRGGSAGPGVGVVEGKTTRFKGTHWSGVVAVDLGVHVTWYSTGRRAGDQGGESESDPHFGRFKVAGSDDVKNEVS